MPAAQTGPGTAVRIATFNAALSRAKPGQLGSELHEDAVQPQIAAVAEIMQRVRADIILINEFDYTPDDAAVHAFIQRYLQIPRKGSSALHYPYFFSAPSNTGVSAGIDLDRDGDANGRRDTFGFGDFPGQYGMLLLSRYPLQTDSIRTFQHFLWRDMPNAKLPQMPGQHNGARSWYSEQALQVFRLSSKSHWDIPIDIDGQIIHLLASHPTPPVFDGDEDRNGRRNHDEIRFWADYLSPSRGSYIYDDNGRAGGLQAAQRFVIVGDLNASPDEGDSTDNPMQLLLQHPLVQGEFIPASAGASEARPDNPFAASHTASWGMRADYVLPSSAGLRIIDGAVFWPAEHEPLHALTGHASAISSDHRLVWLDLTLQALD